MKAGAGQAVAGINAKGGVLGQKLVLEIGGAIQEWAEAATKAGTTDPKKVAKMLRAGTWDTVLRKISYDKKGDVIQSGYVFYIWHSGKYAEM